MSLTHSRGLSPLMRHAGLNLAHVIRDHISSGVDEDTRPQFLCMLRLSTFDEIEVDTQVDVKDEGSHVPAETPGRPVPADKPIEPDQFLYYERDIRHLEIISALAKNETWVSQLNTDDHGHLERCVSIACALPLSKQQEYPALALEIVSTFARLL